MKILIYMQAEGIDDDIGFTDFFLINENGKEYAIIQSANLTSNKFLTRISSKENPNRANEIKKILILPKNKRNETLNLKDYVKEYKNLKKESFSLDENKTKEALTGL